MPERDDTQPSRRAKPILVELAPDAARKVAAEVKDYQCPACGFEANADYVGARNLTERVARWFAAGALRVQVHEEDRTCGESPKSVCSRSLDATRLNAFSLACEDSGLGP